MENLLKKYNIGDITPINYGWSGDKKYILTDKCGTNNETNSILAEIDELIYALTICSDRVSAKNNRG